MATANQTEYGKWNISGLKLTNGVNGLEIPVRLYYKGAQPVDVTIPYDGDGASVETDWETLLGTRINTSDITWTSSVKTYNKKKYKVNNITWKSVIPYEEEVTYSLRISPTSTASTSNSGTLSFKAYYEGSDGSSVDVTNSATWSTNKFSINKGVLNFNNTATTSTSATITASYNGKTTTATASIAGKEEEVSYISISFNPTTISSEGGTGTVYLNVSSNTGWTLNNNTSWISLREIEGDGNARISVTVDPNSNTESRTVTVTGTTTDGKTDTASLTQAAHEEEIITYEFYVVPSESRLSKNETVQLNAYLQRKINGANDGEPQDVTSSCDWTTDNTFVTVSNGGLVSYNNEESETKETRVTATYETYSDYCDVTTIAEGTVIEYVSAELVYDTYYFKANGKTNDGYEYAVPTLTITYKENGALRTTVGTISSLVYTTSNNGSMNGSNYNVSCETRGTEEGDEWTVCEITSFSFKFNSESHIENCNLVFKQEKNELSEISGETRDVRTTGETEYGTCRLEPVRPISIFGAYFSNGSTTAQTLPIISYANTEYDVTTTTYIKVSTGYTSGEQTAWEEKVLTSTTETIRTDNEDIQPTGTFIGSTDYGLEGDVIETGTSSNHKTYRAEFTITGDPYSVITETTEIGVYRISNGCKELDISVYAVPFPQAEWSWEFNIDERCPDCSGSGLDDNPNQDDPTHITTEPCTGSTVTISFTPPAGINSDTKWKSVCTYTIASCSGDYKGELTVYGTGTTTNIYDTTHDTYGTTGFFAPTSVNATSITTNTPERLIDDTTEGGSSLSQITTSNE